MRGSNVTDMLQARSAGTSEPDPGAGAGQGNRAKCSGYLLSEQDSQAWNRASTANRRETAKHSTFRKNSAGLPTSYQGGHRSSGKMWQRSKIDSACQKVPEEPRRELGQDGEQTTGSRPVAGAARDSKETIPSAGQPLENLGVWNT